MLDFFFFQENVLLLLTKQRKFREEKSSNGSYATDSVNVFFNRVIMQQSRTTPAHSDNENGNLSSIPVCWFGNEFNRFFYFFNLLQLISEIFKWSIPNGKYVYYFFFVSDLIFLIAFVIS